MSLRAAVRRPPEKAGHRRLKLSIGCGAVVLVACVVSITSLGLASSGFPDVQGSHPYSLAIHDLASRGIVGGYVDGSYGPDGPVTRQQFAKMAVLTGGYPVSEADVCPFADVEESGAAGLYPDNYVAVCAAKGITEGKTATTFDPVGRITRHQAISMAVRLADDLRPGLLASPPADWASTGDWGNDVAHGANARRAEYSGLLAGLDLSTLSPRGTMTRGEVAQLLHNLLAEMAGTTGSSSTTVASSSTTTAGPGSTGTTGPSSITAANPTPPAHVGGKPQAGTWKIELEQKATYASSPTDGKWWNQAYERPMELGAGVDPFGGVIDMRGRVLDGWGRPLYDQNWVPQVNGDDYKIIAYGNVASIYWAEVWVVSGNYWADVKGWIGDFTALHSFQTGNFATFTGMPATTVTFQAWLDADGDGLVDANELQSNKVRTTFILGVPSQ